MLLNVDEHRLALQREDVLHERVRTTEARERVRLALELHDEVKQDLLAAKGSVHRARRKLGTGHESTPDLDEALALLAECTAALNDVVLKLRNSEAPTSTLPANPETSP
jgi:signal transduction histidine kinase